MMHSVSWASNLGCLSQVESRCWLSVPCICLFLCLGKIERLNTSLMVLFWLSRSLEGQQLLNLLDNWKIYILFTSIYCKGCIDLLCLKVLFKYLMFYVSICRTTAKSPRLRMSLRSTSNPRNKAPNKTSFGNEMLFWCYLKTWEL